MLIVNPRATNTTPGARGVIARALGSEFKVDVASTTHRGHAIELAGEARRDGIDVVIALGGDGTVNEVVNGLLGAGPATGEGATVPLLAVVPGGSTNVFARAVGLGGNAIEATSRILDAARERRHRTIGLGLAGNRYFTFCAGFGLDAEVIAEVEALRRRGWRTNAGLVLRTAALQLLATDPRHGRLVIEPAHGDPIPGAHTALITNTSPWTFLGPLPLNPLPSARFDRGLDVVALLDVRLTSAARLLARMLVPPQQTSNDPSARTLHDLPHVTIRAETPTAFQVDGDALGLRSTVRLESVPDALSVLV